MVTVKILIKEGSPDQLAMYCEPDTEGCSDLEYTAVMILKSYVEAAFAQIMEAGSTVALDLKGRATDKWMKKLFPEKE
jgi:hypothetical protein